MSRKLSNAKINTQFFTILPHNIRQLCGANHLHIRLLGAIQQNCRFSGKPSGSLWGGGICTPSVTISFLVPSLEAPPPSLRTCRCGTQLPAGSGLCRQGALGQCAGALPRKPGTPRAGPPFPTGTPSEQLVLFSW